MKYKNSRREILKLLGMTSAALALPGCTSVAGRASAVLEGNYIDDFIRKNGPINRLVSTPAPAFFSGDNPDHSHSLLWNTSQILKLNSEHLQEKEKAKVVIIGGGLSGLITAYLLRKYQPIVLERADRFGGNAKGESWEGSDYSIGAAYFMEQEKGSPINRLFNEVGVFEIAREKNVDDPVEVHRRIYKDFWTGRTTRQGRSQFQKLARYFKDMLEGKKGLAYPEIPCPSEESRSYIKKLDQKSFYDHVVSIIGGKPHPHIETALEHYCWSTFGSTVREVNAAVGLNAYAAEFGKVYVTPGGNAAVAECFLKKTLEVIPASKLKTGCTALEVEVQGSQVFVAYEDADGKIKSIAADAVVMATPKFVVKRILKNIEPSRRQVIEKLRYRSYLVGNVMLSGAVPDEFYDLYLLGDGQIHREKLNSMIQSFGITDVVLGTYARPRKDKSILTLYRGLPFDGARSQILNYSYSQAQADFSAQIENEILPLLGFKADQKVDLRITRWGHPMPVPQLNFLSDGTVDQLRQPFQERVFFVEQDNWLLPAIETCALEALEWAPKVEKILSV